MLELNAEQIQMGRRATDKLAALALLADGLVSDGLVAPGYLGGMLTREAQGSTYLGQASRFPTAHRKPATRCFTPGCG
jgi:phosphocarrier protein FPr